MADMNRRQFLQAATGEGVTYAISLAAEASTRENSAKAFLCTGLALMAVSISAAAAAPPAVLPDGPGKAEVQATCVKCHAADVIVKKRGTKDDWVMVISDMQNRGAEVADADFDTISAYLATHFGKSVNVNKAAAGDFINWFSMTKTEADALVAYRDGHGDFKSIDDLLKVPDVDPKKIQARSANITFQEPSPADAH